MSRQPNIARPAQPPRPNIRMVLGELDADMAEIDNTATITNMTAIYGPEQTDDIESNNTFSWDGLAGDKVLCVFNQTDREWEMIQKVC